MIADWYFLPIHNISIMMMTLISGIHPTKTPQSSA